MDHRTRRGAAATLLAIAAALLLVSSAPAGAQYGTTTTSTTRATSSTTRATTTSTEAPSSTTTPTTTPVTVRPADQAPVNTSAGPTTTAPPPVVVHDEVSLTIVPGVPAPIDVDVTDDEGNAVAFDSDIEPAVSVNGTGSQPGAVAAEVVATIDEDGLLTIDINVPEGTPPQIVTVTVRAVDSRGTTRSLVYLIPVGSGGTRTTSTTAAGGAGGAESSAKGVRFDDVARIPDAELPLLVRQIQAAIPDDATEQALLAELRAEPGSALAIDYDADADATLAVSVRPIDSSDGSSRGLIAGLAAAAAVGGLVVLRRRSVSITSKGSK